MYILFFDCYNKDEVSEMSMPKKLLPYSTGSKIRIERTKRNLTQKQLADVTGISESTIRHYELGNAIPTITQLKKIADALNISEYALLEYPLGNETAVMHALFELEERYGIYPSIEYKDSVLGEFIQQWMETLEKYRDGNITFEEYKEWETRFPKQKEE